jgi:hypothetical protein
MCNLPHRVLISAAGFGMIGCVEGRVQSIQFFINQYKLLITATASLKPL